MKVASKRNIIAVVIAILAIGIGVGLFASLASRPPETIIAGENPIPVLLIHGLGQDGSVWQTWEDLLEQDGVAFHTITFQESDDKCGMAIEHAREIGKRVQEIIDATDYEQVNIVGHSKGGIDARVYLAGGTDSVANLIMIGTPNAGSPMAERTNACTPGLWDVLPEANATKAEMNPNTNYYTIAGEWEPDVGGDPTIEGADDGLVPVSSVESEGYFMSLGRTDNQHLELLGEEEYDLAKDVLLGNR